MKWVVRPTETRYGHDGGEFRLEVLDCKFRFEAFERALYPI